MCIIVLFYGSFCVFQFSNTWCVLAFFNVRFVSGIILMNGNTQHWSVPVEVSGIMWILNASKGMLLIGVLFLNCTQNSLEVFIWEGINSTNLTNFNLFTGCMCMLFWVTFVIAGLLVNNSLWPTMACSSVVLYTQISIAFSKTTSPIDL